MITVEDINQLRILRDRIVNVHGDREGSAGVKVLDKILGEIDKSVTDIVGTDVNTDIEKAADRLVDFGINSGHVEMSGLEHQFAIHCSKCNSYNNTVINNRVRCGDCGEILKGNVK